MESVNKTTKDKIFKWIITLLPLVFIVAVLLGPLIWSFTKSFTDYSMYRPEQSKFIGLGNYIDMLQSSRFWKILSVSFIFTVVTIILPNVIAVFLANLINMRVMGKTIKGKTILRVFFLIPMIMSETVVGAFTRVFLWSGDIGIINFLIEKMGINPPNWFIDERLALVVPILTYTLIYFSFGFIIFDAGIRNIPGSFYETALVEGATPLTKFFKITLPCLKPQLAIVLIITLTRSWRQYDLIWIMTRGGPGLSTQVLSLRTYLSFMRYGEFGYASALSWFMIISLALMSLGILLSLQRGSFSYTIEK